MNKFFFPNIRLQFPPTKPKMLVFPRHHSNCILHTHTLKLTHQKVIFSNRSNMAKKIVLSFTRLFFWQHNFSPPDENIDVGMRKKGWKKYGAKYKWMYVYAWTGKYPFLMKKKYILQHFYIFTELDYFMAIGQLWNIYCRTSMNKFLNVGLKKIFFEDVVSMLNEKFL